MIDLPDIDDLLGLPYRKDARGPDAYSCLGLVLEVYRRAGHPIPEPTAEGSEDLWETLPLEQAQPGDVLLIDTPPAMLGSHVAILWEGGRIIQVREGEGVAMNTLDRYRTRIPFVYRLK